MSDSAYKYLHKINALRGAEEFKAFAKRLCATAGKQMSRPAMLLSIESGCGASTIFRHYAKITVLASGNSYGEPSLGESTLTRGNERFDNMGDSISYIDDFMDGHWRNCFLMFDISDFLGNRLSDPYLTKFLMRLNEIKDYVKVALRLPYVSEDKYAEVLEFISSYLFIEGVRVPPVPDSELVDYMAGDVKKELNLTVSPRLEGLFFDLLNAKRAKGRFFYYKTANIIYTDILLMREQLILQKKKPSICALAERLLGYYRSSENGDPSEELRSLIGLKEIKQKIEEITANILYMKKREPNKRANIHMLFTGPPGTGKTIVARITGRIFKENGILPIGDLIEVTRKDLVGEYIGQTAIKTAELVKSAIGSVLFIDEAYALTNETIDRKDLGYEAVATLISEMENRVGEFAVIMAGYEDELERLFELNVGLRDRFAYKIGFKSYTRQELFDIFVYQTKDKYNCGADLLTMVEGFFEGLSEEFIGDNAFANARFVRNLSERAVSKAVLRHAENGIITADNKITIEAEDFNRAVRSKDVSELLNAKARKRIGFNK